MSGDSILVKVGNLVLKISQNNKLLVPADKTRNFYNLEKEKYVDRTSAKNSSKSSKLPPNHKLHKICNTNTLKLSYSCLPNMSAEISKHNSKILKPDVVNVALSKSCNCRDKTTCPLPQYGCMAMKSVVYQATVTREDNNRVETYAGLTADHFNAGEITTGISPTLSAGGTLR